MGSDVLIMSIIILLLLIQTKHLLVDWCWQPDYEVHNKGTYGHFGGIRHGLKNAIGTALCFVPFVGWYSVVAICLIDFVVHYHIDFFKMKTNSAMKWGPLTHAQFWWLTGFDQYLHQMTYILLIVIFVL
jgi:hypothetical protein